MIANQTLTIGIGTQLSQDFELTPIYRRPYRFAQSLMFVSPLILPETITILIKALTNTGPLQSNGIDIVLPQGKTTQVIIANAHVILQLKSNVNVAGNRIFDIIQNYLD